MKTQAVNLMYELGEGQIRDVEESKKIIVEKKLCPYYTLMAMGEKAKVIIVDYHHIFHPGVSEMFLMQTKKKIENSIIINLGSRRLLMIYIIR